MVEQEDRPTTDAEDSGVVLHGDGEWSAAQWRGAEQRLHDRLPVQASRPLALRLLDDRLRPMSRWMLADILDISLGGLCLMVSEDQPFSVGQWLCIDVRSHPAFGLKRIETELRWFLRAQRFTTLGVSFVAALDEVPRLEVERRTVRRDPNDEPWALE